MHATKNEKEPLHCFTLLRIKSNNILYYCAVWKIWRDQDLYCHTLWQTRLNRVSHHRSHPAEGKPCSPLIFHSLRWWQFIFMMLFASWRTSSHKSHSYIFYLKVQRYSKISHDLLPMIPLNPPTTISCVAASHLPYSFNSAARCTDASCLILIFLHLVRRRLFCYLPPMILLHLLLSHQHHSIFLHLKKDFASRSRGVGVEAWYDIGT